MLASGFLCKVVADTETLPQNHAPGMAKTRHQLPIFVVISIRKRWTFMTYQSLENLARELIQPTLICALNRISDHTSAYRGFSITKLKRNKRNPITRYHVRQGDESYGKFDALAQATDYIDRLYKMRG
ncbi:TPA: hypothetical protein ACPZO2_003803 [Yersinia enterocolitica]